MSPDVPRRRPIIMVSSTVYGIEELLDRIYALLVSFGYEVWMSHKGTLPVTSERGAFDNCLLAVERCDLFLSLITPFYGSGIEARGELSFASAQFFRFQEAEGFLQEQFASSTTLVDMLDGRKTS